MNSENYSITKNDLKYKKMRNLDVNKISTFDKNNKKDFNEELSKLYYNENLDTLEYRLKECKKEGGKILDLKHLELKDFPQLPNDIINNLEELYISNNDIEILPNLDNFKNLKILDVSVNKLKKIGKLPLNLIEFCCFENNLEDISEVSKCKDLIILYICNNKIKNLSFLNENKKIEILLANFNKIEDIPKDLPKIRKIQIKENNLKKVKSYNTLIYLDCRNNNISIIEEQENLKDLILSNNDIAEIPVFNKLKYLEIVNTNIEKIKYMKQLEELICLAEKVKYISSKYKLEKSIVHKDKFLNLFFIPN